MDGIQVHSAGHYYFGNHLITICIHLKPLKMSTIYLNTIINADIHYVFDLARDIDLHQQSTSTSHETAIAGRTSGLIEENETVT